MSITFIAIQFAIVFLSCNREVQCQDEVLDTKQDEYFQKAMPGPDNFIYNAFGELPLVIPNTTIVNYPNACTSWTDGDGGEHCEYLFDAEDSICISLKRFRAVMDTNCKKTDSLQLRSKIVARLKEKHKQLDTFRLFSYCYQQLGIRGHWFTFHGSDTNDTGYSLYFYVEPYKQQAAYDIHFNSFQYSSREFSSEKLVLLIEANRKLWNDYFASTQRL